MNHSFLSLMVLNSSRLCLCRQVKFIEMNMGVRAFQSIVALGVGLLYVYKSAMKFPHGIQRFIAVSPLIVLCIYLPWQFSSMLLRGISCFLFQWVCALKLLMLSFHVGPLATPWALDSLLHFVVMALLPIRLHSGQVNNKKESKTSLKFLFVEACLLSMIIWSYSYREVIPHNLIPLLYCFHTYFALNTVLTFLRILVAGLFEVELQPSFNKPYLSSSLQDFWGRRWNLTISALLHESVYNSIMFRTNKKEEGVSLKDKKEEGVSLKDKKVPIWYRVIATLCTFVVSGLLHELTLYCMSGSKPSWEHTAFFTLHGFCVVIEAAVKKCLCHSVKFPRLVSVPVTIAFLYITALWLYFPPITRSGGDLSTIAELHDILKFLRLF